MAGEDDEGPERPRRAGSERKLDRRDVLLGLSTVPALGLFGYAWQKQREYEQAAAGGRAARRRGRLPPTCPRSTWPCSAREPRAQVLLDAMLRIPGLRFRAVCDIWKEYNQKRAVNTLRKYKFEVNGTKTTGRCSTRRRTSTRS